MISDHKKEEIRDSADIVEVVSDYVKLKRSGSGFTGLCPFHNEKTPSFHVTPNLGIYKCFGCGAGGDVFNFVMEMEGVGFTEALRTLAERFNVDLPQEQPTEPDETYQIKEGIYHALKSAGMFFYKSLVETDEGQKALNYLKNRGFTSETIKKYGLGYAPGSGQSFLNWALKQGLDEAYLHEAGLVKMSQDGQRTYDTYRERVMFPIFNPSGKVIAFGGRILKKSDKAPKYINSPQTKVYNKSESLYGIQVAKNEIRKEKEAILVEGYTDVLALHQAGLRNAIATSGTALTAEQMRVLHRYGDTLLFIYDSDNAGQAAMLRGINIALEEGLGVRVLKLPEGDDPDSFVKQFGKEGFLSFKKEHAKDFVSHMVDAAILSGEWDDPVTQKRAISRILTSISSIPDAVSRDTYVQMLSRLSKVGDRALYEELGIISGQKNRQEKRREMRQKNQEQAQSQRQSPPQQEEAPPYWENEPVHNPPQIQKKPTIIACEKEAIRLMLQHGRPMVEYIAGDVGAINEQFYESEEMRMMHLNIIERYEKKEPISIKAYMDRGHPFPQIVGDVIMERYSVSEHGNKKRITPILKDSEPYKVARGNLKALKLLFLDRKRSEFQNMYRNADDSQKKEISEKLKEIILWYNKLQHQSADELFELSEKEKQALLEKEQNNNDRF